MWIVKLALTRPHTFVVMALLIAILGVVTIARVPVDIFPEIDIPVVAVVWFYGGISPEDMETRVTSGFERILFPTVRDIEHVESQSLSGIGVVKVFLQPGAKVEAATAQIAASAQTLIRGMPPGISPPLVIRYSASNVPIIQISLASETLSEQEIFDIAANALRTGYASVRGASAPWPSGGRQRQVAVDLDPEKLYAWGLSPSDVSAALGAQNLILPAGTAKIGDNEYFIRLNSSPLDVAGLNDLPIKTVNGTTVTIRDVAHVRDGFAPQTNIVNVNGRRGVVQPILKSGASTLEIVSALRERMPAILTTLPRDLEVELIADQSLFVRAAIDGVVREAVLAAVLIGLLVLLFLGSWRSTLVILISIPLSILVSIVVLAALGETLNVMTLGGLALSVGILVDDATVEIENIHRNLRERKPLVQAILDGARQVAVPAFVSTLCICVVFVPVAFIAGAARFLFVPLAMAVVFAMLTSYLLSRTLVPTMVQRLLRDEARLYQEEGGAAAAREGPIWRLHAAFDAWFGRLRAAYGRGLAFALSHRRATVFAFLAFVAGSVALYPAIGWDFFPSVDTGQIRLHVRAPAGTRIEETERRLGRVEDRIRELIPPREVRTVVANMGIPNSGINLALSDGSLVSPAEGELLVTLDPLAHAPTAALVRRLREELPRSFPDLVFFFQPPDMVTQVLNFGLPAPIDVQVVGPRPNLAENLAAAHRLRDEIARIPGAVDVHLQQVVDTPELRVDVDRVMASELGLTQRDVANDVLISLSSSGQTAPNFWLDPRSGIQYGVAVQTPQFRIDSVGALRSTPIASAGEVQLLGNLASLRRAPTVTNATHYNLAPTFDVLAGAEDADLGSVAKAVDAVVARIQPTLPRGSTIAVRGQASSMRASFRGLASGLLFSVVLVYLLMVVNFQSWLDPLIVVAALPAALGGILWALFATDTTVSVPALMGAIMSVGVATANSILLVTFANEVRKTGESAADAAFEAGLTRLRPVVMTALAMLLGMLPMALGMGEGGEQNAPLGRAVVGGLLAATVATLFLVPVVYGALHGASAAREGRLA
jgi:multidrug efflux pump subunit AcrB